MKTVYSLDEIALTPKRITDIESRKNVNPYDKNGKLPIFVSPMTCVLNTDNYDLFNSKTYAVLPVFADKGYLINASKLSDGWFAVPLNLFREVIESQEEKGETDKGHYMICVDLANGHMAELYTLAKRYKAVFPNSKLMTGNIANSEAYIECCNAEIDYIRVGIGGGTGCTTSAKTGFHKGITALLEEINQIRRMRKLRNEPQFITKVIADGGINTIARAIKCLALGADYVMMGSLFAMCEESAGKKCYVTKHLDPFNKPYFDVIDMDDEDYQRLIKEGDKPYTYAKATKYYGQASIEGQIDRFGKVKSSPEGLCTYLPVQYTYNEFINEFTSVLRCAMSYGNAITLDDFIGKMDYEIQSINEYNLYNK